MISYIFEDYPMTGYLSLAGDNGSLARNITFVAGFWGIRPLNVQRTTCREKKAGAKAGYDQTYRQSPHKWAQR
jgi:hypothetical protein